MANLNIKFNNKIYSIDPTSLADALASLEGHLAAMVDEPAEPAMLAPGLYQTGAIALYEAGNYEAASAMMTTSWDELVASGVVHVDGEPISPDDLSEKNEYGFYYGVAYSANADKGAMVVKFNEDGSADATMAGQLQTIPAGTAVYSSLTIDMSAVNWGVGIVSANGLSIAFADVGLTFVLGEPVVIYTNVDLNTAVNSSSDALDGNLVIPQDITDLGNFNVDEHVGNLAFTVCEKLTGVIIPASVVRISDAAFADCASLSSIIFEGTVEQWNAIAFGNWNENVPATHVHCTDGDVAL